MHARDLIVYLKGKNYIFEKDSETIYSLSVGDAIIRFDIQHDSYSIDGISCGHGRILDLTKKENHSVVMLLIKLLRKGYSKNIITLEKQWQLGHDDSGSLDVMLKNPRNQDVYMFEVKSFNEISKFTDVNNEKRIKQVFSYAIQQSTSKVISYYAYDFESDSEHFYNVYVENLLKISQDVDDLYDRWNKIFDKTDYIANNDIFDIKYRIKKYNDLETICENDTQILYKQFLTILRLHSISDKPNAFMKIINLLLAKIADEITYDKLFKVKDKYSNEYKFNGVKFQFINDIDTPETFIKRLNELYKMGMQEYLNKEVIDYTDEEIGLVINQQNNAELFAMFDNLRLKKNNNFSFIEVYDDDTFYENFEVVREIVKLLEGYKFKYETKHQFLGDFFENLLNTSLKQEAGQFFTPYPIVDFMIDSLPFEDVMIDRIGNNQSDFIPRVIDYACGAGHFLISAMSKIQRIVFSLAKSNNEFTPTQKMKLNTYCSAPFSWVNKEHIVGIEKDYRLAKTTKIATFLNGDGDADIISGDGINKFTSKEYYGSVLYTEKKKLEKFDFVIANPPYAIDGFMRNFIKNGINPESGDFSLLTQLNYADSTIEKFFVERAEQLLVKNGYAAIILPQSVLSNEKYSDLRKFIFENFKILGMMLTADVTFSGTSTSPVVLFLKKEKIATLDYELLLVCSPKYLTPTGFKLKKKEVCFLGYEFSSNREKAGITIYEESDLKHICSYMNKFIRGVRFQINEKYHNNVFVRKISDILLNSEECYVGDLYPKYIVTKGQSISHYCKVNSRVITEFDTAPTMYVEIGDLSNGKLGINGKQISTNRFCKKGDILLSSLCPSKERIVIADGDYMCSSAIHVLSDFKNSEERDWVFSKLKEDKTLVQMNALLDGFKITYAKISEENLKNNVKI